MKKIGYLLLLVLAGATISLRRPAPSSTVDAVPMPSSDASRPASIRPVHWSVVDAGSVHDVRPGRATPISLQAEIAKGWHIYSLAQKPGGPIPLSIRLLSGSDAVMRGVIKAPQPERQFDKNFGIETELYSGSRRFTVEVAVPSRSSAGRREILIGARYQVCSETLCLPPRTDTLRTTLRIGGRA
jgi:DsbC/DsbD-like thiol-disulfide interchange protein